MSDAVSIDFPKADSDALWAQVDRAQKALGKSLGAAVRFAAWSVATSLGARTRVAEKFRPYKEIKETAKERRVWGGQKLYRVTSHKKGGPIHFVVRSKGVADLKKKPQVQIGQRGLAKMAWFWGISQIGGGRNIGKKGASPLAQKSARDAATVTKRLKGDDPFVRLTNKLPYARNALTGGESALNTAMGSAARHMAKIIDGNIAKKFGVRS